MATKLTVKALENFKPGPARREVPDGDVVGLYLVIQPNGKRSWAYRYRFNGRPRKFTIKCDGKDLGETLRNARNKAREASGKVANGIDPGVEKKAAKSAAAIPANDLVEHVTERFVSHYAKRQLKAATAKEVERLLDKEIVEPWRARRLSQIGRADIHDLLDSIVERGSPVTANRTLAWLRRMCSWAIERGLMEVNPSAGIKAPAAETARDRVLSDEELKAVWQAADAQEQPYAAFVKLLILTGARRNEVAELRWQELDLDAKTWTLPKERSKNGREHSTPLSDSVVGILKKLSRIDGSGFVFTLNGRNRITAFYPVKQRLDSLMPSNTAPPQCDRQGESYLRFCRRRTYVAHRILW